MAPEYTEKYFDYQRMIGQFGGVANHFKFVSYVTANDTVLDYGCGGGYLLANITAANKIGIEVNPAASKVALSHGLTVYDDIGSVPEKSVSVIISNHTLEHVERPLDALRSLRSKLRTSESKIVLVVPHEGISGKYWAGDPNQHLYTWNPLTLGNLFVAAGFVDPRISLIRHKWPRGYLRIQKLLGWRAFNILASLNAYAHRDHQLRVVASRGKL